MATPDDRKAGLVVLGLASLGLVVRLCGSGGAPPGGVAFRWSDDARPARDTVAAAARRLLRPLGPREQVDLDRAPAEELARIPGIGRALAARIVAYREEHGGIGSLATLDRVPGVGPAVLRAVEPHARFSAPRRPPPGPLPAPVSLNTATIDELTQLPGIGPVRAAAIAEDRRRNGPFRTVEQLDRVRGIGPATVDRLRGRVRVP